MAEVSGLANSEAATAVAVEQKTREHIRALQQGMIKLIEGAAPEPKPLPPDATFSTYA
jgi:hypothetical protein